MEKLGIGFRLEEALVRRIREEFPALSLVHRPDLLPERRYPCDHIGDLDKYDLQLHEGELKDAFSEVTVLLGSPLPGVEGLERVVAEYCPQLSWIQGTAAGFAETLELVRLPASMTSGISFTSAAGIHAPQLGEWALLSLLYFWKDIPRVLRSQAQRRWEVRPFDEIRGATVVILGFGHVGRRVADLCTAFGMNVVAVSKADQSRNANISYQMRSPADLKDLVARSDALVACLPGTRETKNLVSASVIAALPRDAVFINIGTATTLEIDALANALLEGRLRGAALDVTDPEPLPETHAFWSMPNVLISSHSAALGLGEDDRLVDLFIRNMHLRLAGQELENQIYRSCD